VEAFLTHLAKAKNVSVLAAFCPAKHHWKPVALAVFLETVIRVFNKVKGRGAGSADAGSN
jgi:hypothetical protein